MNKIIANILRKVIKIWDLKNVSRKTINLLKMAQQRRKSKNKG